MPTTWFGRFPRARGRAICAARPQHLPHLTLLPIIASDQPYGGDIASPDLFEFTLRKVNHDKSMRAVREIKDGLTFRHRRPPSAVGRSDLASQTNAAIHRPRKSAVVLSDGKAYLSLLGLALLLPAEGIERLGQSVGRNPNSEIAPCGVFPCETTVT
jgi:hypothetical protein